MPELLQAIVHLFGIGRYHEAKVGRSCKRLAFLLLKQSLRIRCFNIAGIDESKAWHSSILHLLTSYLFQRIVLLHRSLYLILKEHPQRLRLLHLLQLHLLYRVLRLIFRVCDQRKRVIVSTQILGIQRVGTTETQFQLVTSMVYLLDKTVITFFGGLEADLGDMITGHTIHI